MTATPKLSLDAALRPEDYCAIFKAHRRLHIPGILTSRSATEALAALKPTLDWTRSIHVDAGEDVDIPAAMFEALPLDEKERVERELSDSSTDNLQYMFDTVRISARLKRGEAVDTDLGAVHAFLNSQIFLDFVRALTGDVRPDFCDVMATRYLPGHFLTAHGDEHPTEHRLYAYVLNLTPVWRADWGGVLMFLDEDGHVSEGYVPSFNSLNIFQVPQTHAVSMVSRLARGPRLSFTGWIHAKA